MFFRFKTFAHIKMADKSSTGNPLEQFVLLAKTAKGHAAVGLVKQALEASIQ